MSASMIACLSATYAWSRKLTFVFSGLSTSKGAADGLCAIAAMVPTPHHRAASGAATLVTRVTRADASHALRLTHFNGLIHPLPWPVDGPMRGQRRLSASGQR